MLFNAKQIRISRSEKRVGLRSSSDVTENFFVIKLPQNSEVDSSNTAEESTEEWESLHESEVDHEGTFESVGDEGDPGEGLVEGVGADGEPATEQGHHAEDEPEELLLAVREILAENSSGVHDEGRGSDSTSGGGEGRSGNDTTKHAENESPDASKNGEVKFAEHCF